MNAKQLQNNIQISLLCLLVCLQAMVTEACKSIGPAVGGDIRPGRGDGDYVSLSKERSVLLYPETPAASPKLDIVLSLLDVTRPENRFILDVLYDDQSAEEYAGKRLHGYDTMYGEMRKAAEKNPGMSREALNWFYHETFACHTGTSQVAVMSREREYYTGGAHSMRNKDYYVFSLGDKRRLSLWDIIRDDAKQVLDTQVEEALRKYMEIPSWIPLSEGGFFEDSVDKLEDFFLSPQGLAFQWDPYEIAPYSSGLIEITLPYDQLQGLLTERGIVLINGFR